MPRPPSIQWYYKQWLGDKDVLAMDWDATGMHFHLLMMSIQETPPGTIPNDVGRIRRWLRLPSGQGETDRVWARVQPQIFAAWTLANDRWANLGMVRTFERAEKYRNRYENGTRIRADTKHTEDSTALEVEFDLEQATSFVFLEVGLAGIEARMLVSDAVKSHIHNNKSTPRQAAEALVSIWQEYEAADIDFKKGVFKFFKEGLWKQPRSEWGRRTLSESERREARSQQEANIGVWRPT